MPLIPEKISQHLHNPVKTNSLVLLRVAFGLIMLWEVIRYFLEGWVWELFRHDQFHFKYLWFQWVEPLPPPWMTVVFLITGASALLIALGWFYRIASIVFFILYLYTFLIDKAYYNNHFYLIAIIAFLFVVSPLHHTYSLDAHFGRVQHVDRFPAFWLWLLRFPMTLGYVYGGIAKIEPDWLSGKAPGALIGKGLEGTFLEAWVRLPSVSLFYGWSGLLFDFLIPFAVLWKPTRKIAFLSAVLFHTHNYFVFSIGIFPLLALFLTTLYFEPDFPEQWIPLWIKQQWSNWYCKKRKKSLKEYNLYPSKGLVSVLSLLILIQLLVPFRHLFYPGWTVWHEEGHWFAWRMMLRQKTTQVLINATHPKTRETRYVELKDYLNDFQISKFAGTPNMVLQFAHHIRDLIRERAKFEPIITAQIMVSMNGREFVPMLDSKLDLSPLESFEPAYNWVNPEKP